jgi:hypothetical protein
MTPANPPCPDCDAIPWNPDAAPGDWDYRPGPDWPPSLDEMRGHAERQGMRERVWRYECWTFDVSGEVRAATEDEALAAAVEDAERQVRDSIGNATYTIRPTDEDGEAG